MDGFLISLDREDEIHLWAGHIIREMGQIDGLNRVEEGEEGNNPLVGPLFFGREFAMKHASIIFEARNFFWHPEISYHHLVEGFGPGIFDGIEIKKTSSGPFNNSAAFDSIISCWIKEEVRLHFGCHKCSIELVSG